MFSGLISAFLTSVCVLIAYFKGQTLSANTITGMYLSFLCMCLVVAQSRLNFLFGGLAACSLAWTAYVESGEMGLALVRLYMLPFIAYGFWRWGRDDNTRPVTSIQLQWIPAYAVVTFAFYWASVVTLEQTTTHVSQVTGAILMTSFLAQAFLVEKKIEAWIVWFFINLLALYVFAQVNDSVMAFQFAIYLTSNVIGYWYWSLSSHKNKE